MVFKVKIPTLLTNKFGRIPDASTLSSLRLKPIVVDGALDPKFSDHNFTFTDGNSDKAGERQNHDSRELLMIIDDHFGELFTTDCKYSEPKIDGDTVIIFVQDLGGMMGHPFHQSFDVGDSLLYLPWSRFIFSGVVRSVMDIDEYIGNPMLGTFRDQYRKADESFRPHYRQIHTFHFEGRLLTAPAMVDWKIEAESFQLEVLPQNGVFMARNTSGQLITRRLAD